MVEESLTEKPEIGTTEKTRPKVEDWEDLNNHALVIVIGRIGPELEQGAVVDASRAKEAWALLTNQFERMGMALTMQLLTVFMQV